MTHVMPHMSKLQQDKSCQVGFNNPTHERLLSESSRPFMLA
jgi:hypothetical protein